MTPSNVARVLFVGAAVVLTAASAGSSQNNNNQNASMMQPYGQAQPGGGGGAPPPQQMEPGRTLGLWRSTFGAVKIEADNSKGGIAAGAVQGVWVYQRQGQEVIGYFSGNLRGNVMNFRWQEPGSQGGAPLNGEGWLQFDTAGRQYSGRWWTDRKDRVGDWNGWRQPGEGEPQDDQQQPGSPNSDPYAQPGSDGGQQYGSDPRQPPPQPTQPPPTNDRRYY